MSTSGVRIRQTVCSTCGHYGRLVIATPEVVISRCPLCGDEVRTGNVAAGSVPQPAGVPQSAESAAALRG
jgi:hypothetical protein